MLRIFKRVSPEGAIQLAVNGENCVAEGFSIEALPMGAPEVDILRIDVRMIDTSAFDAKNAEALERILQD